jgi:alkaline phosphatase
MTTRACRLWTAVSALAAAAALAACATTTPPASTAANDDGDDAWRAEGEAALAERLARTVNHDRAKNVIIFVADGAGPTFFTAARIHDGQRLGEIGDLHEAPPDLFPYTALARTHSADDRVTDSAAAATAMFNGVKTHNGGLGVAAGAKDCAAAQAGARSSLSDVALASGRAVGFVTTAQVTDATPAALYSHAGNRSWQDPRRMTEADRAAGCRDIPEQLMATDFTVALGGGREYFTPEAKGGVRPDGRDLTAEWVAAGAGRIYSDDLTALAGMDLSSAAQLLALVPGELYRPENFAGGPTTTPTLAEMADAALDVIEGAENGYFLLIEQEGTDELQHDGYLGLALDAGVEMYDAVRLVLERVDLDETLVIVTADHGQPLAMGGGGPLESPLLGLASYNGQVQRGQDGAPFAQLGFYTGVHARVADPDLTDADIAGRSYIPDAAVGVGVTPHSGVDVPVYAIGPWSDLFTGSIEQTSVFNFVRHAMTVED